MTGLEHTNDPKYAYLEKLSTDQLLDELRNAGRLALLDQEAAAYCGAIEEVILRRESEHDTGLLSNADEAWEEFQTHVNTPEGRGLRLFPDPEDPSAPAGHTSASFSPAPGCRGIRIVRKLGMAAATLAVLLACMVAVQASGLDIFGAFARWTEETFHFEVAGNTVRPAGNEKSREYYEALQAAVDELGITEDVVPTWYPEGYEMGEIELLDLGTYTKIFCTFVDANADTYALAIQVHIENAYIDSHLFEKDQTIVEEYIHDGKTFYLMSNMDTTMAVCASENLFEKISGSISKSALKYMINSIGG